MEELGDDLKQVKAQIEKLPLEDKIRLVQDIKASTATSIPTSC